MTKLSSIISRTTFVTFVCLAQPGICSEKYGGHDHLWTTNSTVGMPVNTTSGRIIGHADKMYPYVSEYLSIPFAEPPIGDFRFAPPQRFAGADDVMADKEPASCIQTPPMSNQSWPQDFININNAGNSITQSMSEDCLYINVWTKFPSPGTALKPVMIWFYGGGYHGGGASNNEEQGGIWAEEQDVVLVNFNYRLSIFGFSGAPLLTQNVGLLDQRLAIEWVQANIAGFGGDPERIVIFGHSAGASSIDLYNYAYKDDPIVSGTIPMSGTALSFGSRFPNTTAAGWYDTAASVGCGNKTTTSDDNILACMRTKNTTEVYKASVQANKAVIESLSGLAQGYAAVTGTFGPTIDNITVFQNYSQRGEAGEFIQRPMLIGNNDDEGCFFAMQGEIPVSYEDQLTTAIFTCPNYYTALYRAKAGLPSWKYRYFGAYPNVYASACPGRPWHGQEIYVMFNTTTLSEEPSTPIENNMGWYFREVWSAFAHDPEQGPSNEGWPLLQNGKSNVVVLGLNQTLETVQDASVWDEPCLTTLVSGAPNF